jgi:hypothetical protein
MESITLEVSFTLEVYLVPIKCKKLWFWRRTCHLMLETPLTTASVVNASPCAKDNAASSASTKSKDSYESGILDRQLETWLFLYFILHSGECFGVYKNHWCWSQVTPTRFNFYEIWTFKGTDLIGNDESQLAIVVTAVEPFNATLFMSTSHAQVENNVFTR